MKQTVEEAASENILFNHRTVDRTLAGKDLAKFGEINFVQGAEWQSKQSPWISVEELMPENREFLHTLSNVILLDEDFTKDSVGSYTKIIANPPFTGNQDIEHVRLMYDRLEEGGTLAAITSQHWKFASEKNVLISATG